MTGQQRTGVIHWSDDAAREGGERRGGEGKGLRNGWKGGTTVAGWSNTLVPNQAAHMTVTACLFLASSFRRRSSLRA